MLRLLYFWVSMVVFLLVIACSSNAPKLPTNSNNHRQDLDLGYDLRKADKKIKLSNKLREISGLTYIPDEGLITVQDEKGALYWLDKKGDIEQKVNFSADGDYEGLAFQGEFLYALRADGVLFQIDHWKKGGKKPRTRVINTNLGEPNNTEGIAYHPEKNQLWIACKGSAVIGQERHYERAVYAYDLTLDSFFVKPLFAISRGQLKNFLKEHMRHNPDYSYYKKLIRKEKPNMPLQPSAIAIHPLTQEVYILCAVGNSLLVLNKSFKIKALCRLSNTDFEQPEGLTFNEKGDLFLSSEGQKKKARVYRFNYKLARD